MADNTDDGMKYARYGYWVLFGFAVLTTIVLAILLMLACCHCKNSESCTSRRGLGKFLLVVAGVLSLIFSILALIVLIGSVTFSGACGFVREINKDQLEVLYQFEDLDDQVIDLVNLCFLSNSTGDIETYLSS